MDGRDQEQREEGQPARQPRDLPSSTQASPDLQRPQTTSRQQSLLETPNIWGGEPSSTLAQEAVPLQHNPSGPHQYPTSDLRSTTVTGRRVLEEWTPIPYQPSLGSVLAARAARAAALHGPQQDFTSLSPSQPRQRVVRCMLMTHCLDDSSKERVGLFICRECDTTYCFSCLRSWFLMACKDESLMPPKCCTEINISKIDIMLTRHEVCLIV